VPAPEARTKNIQTLLEQEKANPEDQVVTQLIPLKYADPEEVKRLFTPLVSKNSVILGYAPANTLIITDVQSNIQRLIKILKQIDKLGAGQQISVIPLQHADAARLTTLLTNLFKTTAPRPQQAASAEKHPVIVADERTRTIVVLASEVDTLRIKQLINMIDKETPRGRGKINVYYCEHANAEDLAKVLQEIPSQQSGAGSSAAGGAGGGAAAGASRGPTAVVMGKVQINADKATNSLIIMADTEDYDVVEDVIKKLDIPRSMVYIESLIMEVNATKSFELGIQWQLFDRTNVNNINTVYGGGYSGSGALDTAKNLLSPTGLAVGVLTEPFTFGGLTLSNIGAVINAVKTDDNFRILSTPQILTTDNEEARITVGENRPFQTQATTAVSGGTYESYEYRDVGKILKITPHVSEGRNVRLNFLDGSGINSSFAVFQDATGRAMERTLAIGIAIGSGYLFPTTFEREVVSDLTGERGILMGALAGVMEAQYNLLRQNGHSPSEAFNETVEELTQSLIGLVGAKGMDWMFANCSTTAQRGALDWKNRFRDAVAPVYDELYQSVVSGEETRIVIEANSAPDYKEKLTAELDTLGNSEMWQTGKTVRSLRPENWKK